MTKTAYLTIDDSPSVDMNEKVDFLARKGIPAVWFCLGEQMEERSEMVIRALQQGFVLGNHSYNHPAFSTLETAECFEQIRRTDEIIENLYHKAAVKRPGKYFRFPYGDKGSPQHKKAIQSYLRQLGYVQPAWEQITYRYYQTAGLRDDVDWYWTYDVMEWSIFAEEHFAGIDSLEKVFARMEEDHPEDWRGLNNAGSAEIILMHDHARTSEYFEPLVERLLEKGLVFALPEM